jgi:hypothetical protein
MKCTAEDIVARRGVRARVASTLGNVYFTASWPLSVDAVLWHEPYGGPEPIPKTSTSIRAAG